MTMKRLMLLFTLISGMTIAGGCDQLMPKSTDSATSSSTESEDATDAPTDENKDE